MASEARPRLQWIDGLKGFAILWIVLFHTFKEWDVTEAADPLWAWFSWLVRLAFHSVGVFFLMSGVGLALSMARGRPKNGWIGWYRSRVLRLFPMYWLAHAIIAVSPLATTWEPIDRRFLLSLLGDRAWPIDDMFYYLNASWWYFGTLLQLYLVFPALWIVLESVGTPIFLLLCGAFTIGLRYWLLVIHPVSGNFVQGGFGLCRLWEFAFGMAVGLALAKAPQETERRLFSPVALVAGIVLFTIGVHANGTAAGYSASDALAGTGLFVILAHLARLALRVPPVGGTIVTVGAFSYGLYLLHQPYVITLGHSLQGHGAFVFFAVAFAAIAFMSAVGMQLEKVVNRAVARVLG